MILELNVLTGSKHGKPRASGDDPNVLSDQLNKMK